MTHLTFGRPAVKYNGFLNDLFDLSTWPGQAVHVPGVPASNVYETPEAYHLELNAPGRNKEDFNISVDKDLLTVSWEKHEEKNEETPSLIRREFSFNSFKRSFTLDEKVDAAGIKAKYDNGILKIELPKKEQLKEVTRQIAIS